MLLNRQAHVRRVSSRAARGRYRDRVAACRRPLALLLRAAATAAAGYSDKDCHDYK